jgi:Fe-S cluster biogenesis protein NfuA
MFIQTEITPNPSTLKFIPENKILDKGTYEFKSKEEAKSSKLAMDLFSNKAVTNVFFGLDFITITKSESYDWDVIKPDILSKIMNFFSSGLPLIESDIPKSESNDSNIKYNADQKKIVQQIQTLLDEKIKPAVAQDGGDITFVRLEKNIVYLELRGACAGCPSSTLTLKSGIENMLKYYIPEIESVEAVN